VIAHEFGHFIAAKRNKVKVERFAIGFGPVIFSRKTKETEFAVCAFPLGGYVKMAGDCHADHKGLEYEFLSKPVKTKLKIVFAGPLFNYIFAFFLFWLIALLGFPTPLAVVGKLKDGYPAQKAGLKEDDKIVSVNGKKVDSWADMTTLIRSSKEEVSLEIEREGKNISLVVPLEKAAVGDEFGRKKSISVIGIESSSEVKIIRYNFFSGFLKAADSLFTLTILIVKGFIFMILGILPLKDAVAGPLGIYVITAETAKHGIIALVNLMAILSVSLCIVNLIPLPLFDGGHILIFLIEKIRGRPLTEKADELLTRAGIVIISLIIVFVFYNDVLRFGSKIWGRWF
jgi:regulator of sigma E protease